MEYITKMIAIIVIWTVTGACLIYGPDYAGFMMLIALFGTIFVVFGWDSCDDAD